MKKQDINQLFIDKVNELIDNKTYRNRREIVDILGWNETALSAVMSGKRGVPEEKAEKFFELNKVEKKDKDLKKGTPIYELAATAGQMDNVSQLPEVPSFYVTVPGYEDCDFGVRIYGNSMYPTIETGSLVMCKSIKDKSVIMYGEVYVVRTRDYLMAKRLQKAEAKGHVLCTSDNFEQRTPDFRRFESFELAIDKISHLFLIKGIFKKTQS